jgi:hypothetical protein
MFRKAKREKYISVFVSASHGFYFQVRTFQMIISPAVEVGDSPKNF